MSNYCRFCESTDLAPENEWLPDWMPENGELPTCKACVKEDKVQDAVLDLKIALRNRDAGLEDVEANANQAWIDLSLKIIRILAESSSSFTSDQVWEELASYPEIKTHQPSAMGAVFRKAAALNIIEATDRFIQSQRPSSHARPIRVWNSKIKENHGMANTTTSQAG